MLPFVNILRPLVTLVSFLRFNAFLIFRPPVATDVAHVVRVCVCVSVLVIRVYCAKTGELIEMPYGG